MKHIDWDAEMVYPVEWCVISAEADSVEWCVDFRALLLPGLATGAVVAVDSWAALRRHDDLYLLGEGDASMPTRERRSARRPRTRRPRSSLELEEVGQEHLVGYDVESRGAKPRARPRPAL